MCSICVTVVMREGTGMVGESLQEKHHQSRDKLQACFHKLHMICLGTSTLLPTTPLKYILTCFETSMENVGYLLVHNWKRSCRVVQNKKKVLALSATETNNTLKMDKLCDCDPYIMCMIFMHYFAFTAHCMDCNRLFCIFKTVE